MSIIVLGMEMPGSCAKCRIKYWIYNDPYCPIIKSSLNWNKYSSGEWTGVDKRCPLRPLPEKHGKLIDANALVGRFEPKQAYFTEAIINKLGMAPVIVEAEGERR